MSPKLLRRYRADRMLHEEFERLRGRVIAAVDGRLRRAGVPLDRSDLEAAYAQAWHGLYGAVLEGRAIDSPAAWLTVVAHRRALDEHRARRDVLPLARGGSDATVPAYGDGRDLADELDDRARLRTLMEAMRARLSERERRAAALCYLQGLSRAEAAAQMGISESRMRKLMEGTGRGLRGVAAKVGALAQAIAAGEWCQEQGSLMRGLAFGVLDPHGDRYQLATLHSEQCPACRAYVLSLRGLAAALPPVPVLLHQILGAGAGAGTLAGSCGAGVGGPAGATSAPLGPSVGAGALSASGAAGASAAGGGWWLAGGVGAKLAAGCLLALGVGAGCVVLEQGQGTRPAVHGHARRERAFSDGHAAGGFTAGSATATQLAAQAHAGASGEGSIQAHAREPVEAARASREFGLEQPSSRTQAAAPAGGELARAAFCAPGRERARHRRRRRTVCRACDSVLWHADATRIGGRARVRPWVSRLERDGAPPLGLVRSQYFVGGDVGP